MAVLVAVIASPLRCTCLSSSSLAAPFQSSRSCSPLHERLGLFVVFFNEVRPDVPPPPSVSSYFDSREPWFFLLSRPFQLFCHLLMRSFDRHESPMFQDSFPKNEEFPLAHKLFVLSSSPPPPPPPILVPSSFLRA